MVWALPIVLVLGAAFAFVGWYARNTYYVGVNRGRVAVFQGVKGGLFLWDPTVERRTTIDSQALTETQQADLRDGKKFGSRSGADAYVARLRKSIEPPPTTTIPTPPEATAPPIAAPPPS
jgi:hypothetical protein